MRDKKRRKKIAIKKSIKTKINQITEKGDK